MYVSFTLLALRKKPCFLLSVFCILWSVNCWNLECIAENWIFNHFQLFRSLSCRWSHLWCTFNSLIFAIQSVGRLVFRSIFHLLYIHFFCSHTLVVSELATDHNDDDCRLWAKKENGQPKFNTDIYTDTLKLYSKSIQHTHAHKIKMKIKYGKTEQKREKWNRRWIRLIRTQRKTKKVSKSNWLYNW